MNTESHSVSDAWVKMWPVSRDVWGPVSPGSVVHSSSEACFNVLFYTATADCILSSILSACVSNALRLYNIRA